MIEPHVPRNLLRAMHVTTATNRAAAGVHAAVEGMVGSLGRRPGMRVVEVGVLPADETWEGGADPHTVPRIRLRSFRPRTFSFVPALAGTLAREHPDIIHLHGIWQHPGIVATGRRRPPAAAVVLSPHGMLAPRALLHRPSRKRAAWVLYQRRALAGVDLVHVTSAAERDDVWRSGLRQPVAVIPFGVDVPARCPDRRPTGPLTAVFLSRIHPIKGVVDLVRAWGRVRPGGWRLVIAGPDECGHRAEVASVVAEEGLGDAISIVGPQWGTDRERLVAEADLFVLPSHSENFGIAVAEALALGVPVLTTRGTPWEIVAGAGCGWWVPVGEIGIAAGLFDACGRDRAALLDMGRRGWKLMLDEYAWPTAAERLENAYRWLRGEVPQPACVFLADPARPVGPVSNPAVTGPQRP